MEKFVPLFSDKKVCFLDTKHAEKIGWGYNHENITQPDG